MKKIFRIATGVFLCGLLLAGCGSGSGGGRYKDNPHLGKIPNAYRVIDERIAKNSEDMLSEMSNVKTEDQAMKIRDKYIEKDEAVKKEARELVASEIERLREKPIPVEFDYEDPELVIERAYFSGGSPETGTMSIVVDFRSKRGIRVTRDALLTYMVVDNDGNILFSRSMNPFDDIGAFPVGGPIEAGDEINMFGSQIMLYCASYDLTNFEKILFVANSTRGR